MKVRRLPEALEVWETQSASIEVKFSAKQQCEAMIAAEIKRECSQGGLKLTWDVGRYWNLIWVKGIDCIGLSAYAEDDPRSGSDSRSGTDVVGQMTVQYRRDIRAISIHWVWIC